MYGMYGARGLKTRTRLPLLAALFFLVPPLFTGADPFTMISPGDPLLEDLRLVVREGGKSFLSLTPPLSRDEARQILEGIDPASLSLPARERYRRILDNLAPALTYESPGFAESSGFAAAIHLKAALEGRFRANTAVPWLKKDNTSQALLGLPIHLFFAGALELFAEPLAAADPWYYNHPPSSWGTNVPWEAQRFDLNMPLRAFAAAGGPWWSFQLGRDTLSFGPGRTGNLAVSNNPDYYDFVRVGLFSQNFKYSLLVSQTPMNAEKLIGEPFKSNQEFMRGLRETTGYDVETPHRYLYLHRFDARFFTKLSIGLSEGVMAGYSPLELRYLNPLMIFHSFFSWKDYPSWEIKDNNSNLLHEGDLNGSIFSLDLEWAFLPHWALYGQIVINEFSTPYEQERFPDQPPPGMGYLLGAEYAGALANWAFSCYAELVYTDPYLYILSSPFASMIWMRRSSDLGTKDLRYAYFGHGEGRDMFLAALGVSAAGEKLALALDLSLKRQGEHGLAWDWDKRYNSQNSPSGNPETLIRTLLSVEYRLLPSLTLSGHAGGTLIFDAGHVRGNREYGFEAGLKAAYYY
ncbi:MAG: hypothetical protein LBG84_00385 [Treponema sp.]|jgi:hypothetical protein|nr:hypothetical protein [Treponema sp.]